MRYTSIVLSITLLACEQSKSEVEDTGLDPIEEPSAEPSGEETGDTEDTDTEDTDTDDTETQDPDDVDQDGDGYSVNDGDCDDDDASLNLTDAMAMAALVRVTATIKTTPSTMVLKKSVMDKQMTVWVQSCNRQTFQKEKKTTTKMVLPYVQETVMMLTQ